jgi:hypothetical protein
MSAIPAEILNIHGRKTVYPFAFLLMISHSFAKSLFLRRKSANARTKSIVAIIRRIYPGFENGDNKKEKSLLSKTQL